jgi:hypothetical protein
LKSCQITRKKKTNTTQTDGEDTVADMSRPVSRCASAMRFGA